MNFRTWLENQAEIVPFEQVHALNLPPEGVLSFDFDGVLTHWNQNANGWYQAPFIRVIRHLKEMASKGHRCIICTHRTQELEGNPAFLGHGRDKMKVLDLVQDDVLPLGGNDIIFTHMGDKGQTLLSLRDHGLNVVAHYDDEDGNLRSVTQAGIIGIKVNPGPSPPKYIVAGDGHQPQK